MGSKTVKVGSSIGLRDGLATAIAAQATAAGVPITLNTPGGEPVDAGSALLIMRLDATHGDEVVVTSDDDDRLEAVAAMVEQDLDI